MARAGLRAVVRAAVCEPPAEWAVLGLGAPTLPAGREESLGGTPRRAGENRARMGWYLARRKAPCGPPWAGVPAVPHAWSLAEPSAWGVPGAPCRVGCRGQRCLVPDVPRRRGAAVCGKGAGRLRGHASPVFSYPCVAAARGVASVAGGVLVSLVTPWSWGQSAPWRRVRFPGRPERWRGPVRYQAGRSGRTAGGPRAGGPYPTGP